MSGRDGLAVERREFDVDALDRTAQDIYGSARGDRLLGFCQRVVHLCSEYRRVRAQRDELSARLLEDPKVSLARGVATMEGIANEFREETGQCHAILDWIGVAAASPDPENGASLALAERVRILALQLATRQGYSLDEAERLCPPAFVEASDGR